MSRLDRITRWVLEPAHSGRTLFLINREDYVVGTNSFNEAVYLVKIKGNWERLAVVSGKHLVHLEDILCHGLQH